MNHSRSRTIYGYIYWKYVTSVRLCLYVNVGNARMTMCVTYATSIVLIILTFMAKCGARSKLSLWIDEDQIENIIGHPMRLHIIYEGNVINYLSDSELEASLPSVPSNVDTVNLTWEAGDELFTYWFDVLKSRNTTILYNPLLSIPASGIIPKGPKIFQISIPCTGNGDGVATLVLGLKIMDQHDKPIRGSPIKLKLRKQCHAFETTKLCNFPCEHGGRCNQIGECECTQGFHGEFCEIDMCRPSCENNGTCISPNMCLCLDSFYGKRCEKALCNKPCQNGGRCVQTGVRQPGICWCTSGFFGEACEYSYCTKPCRHDGLCTGPDKCHCKAGYSGDHCEKGADRTRRRVNTIKAEKRRLVCKRKRDELAKRCTKGKRCKSKQERINKRCLTQKEKRRKRCKRRQEQLTKRCLKQKDKRRKRCKKKQAEVTKRCQKDKNIIKTKKDLTQDNTNKQNAKGNR